MRTISAAARAALNAESTAAVFPLLIELSHPNLPDPLRFVNNSVDLSYGGHTYLAYPFRFDPPDEEAGGGSSSARLTISNVSQEIIAELRSVEEAFTVKVVAMYWNDDGGPVFEPLAQWEFRLESVSYTADIITGNLVFEDRLNNRVPALTFTPADFPGVH